jgi:hypothetical protein
MFRYARVIDKIYKISRFCVGGGADSLDSLDELHSTKTPRRPLCAYFKYKMISRLLI